MILSNGGARLHLSKQLLCLGGKKSCAGGESRTLAEDSSTVPGKEAKSTVATPTEAMPNTPHDANIVSPIPLPVAERRPVSGQKYVISFFNMNMLCCFNMVSATIT